MIQIYGKLSKRFPRCSSSQNPAFYRNYFKVSSDPPKIYYSPGFLSTNPGVLPFLMGELVRKKIDSALNYGHQQANLKRLKAARAGRVEVFGNKRVSKLGCSLIRYWCMGLLNVSCAEAHSGCELCLRNLREQLPSILQLLSSVSQGFHFSVSLLEYNHYFKRVSALWKMVNCMCESGPC